MTQQTEHPRPPGQLPAGIRCAADYARLAPDYMAPSFYAYVAGGSANDVTARANLAAFSRLAIVPRMLRNLAHGNTHCSFAGVERPHPIMLAPIGWQALAHPEGEQGSARAAAATQSCFVASTVSSASLEDIASCAGPDRWFQLYWQPEREVTLDLVRRAEKAHYRAIVLTVDTPIQLPSFQALAAGFHAPDHVANLAPYPRRAPVKIPRDASAIFQGFMRDAPMMEDISWLCRATDLPVWIKGIMHADDADELANMGVAGIIVSNHGGRALDGGAASLDALVPIRAGLGDQPCVLFDGGIRSGTDIFKALALGADGVMVGRLQICALAVAGALGVAHMIRLLREELESCMALAGCATLADIRKATIIRVEEGVGQHHGHY